MNVLIYLIPISIFLGGLGLAAFIWFIRSDQMDDPEGEANRILSDRYDERPLHAERRADADRDNTRS